MAGDLGRFLNTPTNLNARGTQTGDTEQYVGIVDMICEGPIRGLVDGKRSVFLDNVPFEDAKNVGSPLSATGGTYGGSTLSVTNGGTTGTASGYTFNTNDVGKYIVIEIANQQFSGAQITAGEAYNGFLMITLNNSTSATIPTTYNNNLLFAKFTKGTALKDDTLDLEGEVNVNTTTHDHIFRSNDAPTSISINTSVTHTLRIYAAFKIASVNTGSNSMTLNTSSGASYATTWPQGTGNSNFWVQDARPVEPSLVGPGAAAANNIKKVEASTLQFRRGTSNQGPFSDVNGVAGGITVTGSGANTPVKQPATLPTEVTAAGFSYGSWDNGRGKYDTYGYPPGQSFADNSGVVVTIPASGSGLSFGLNGSQISQVDEVNIRIAYSALYTMNTENADKESAHAHYVFQIQTTLDSTNSDWKTLFSQHGGTVVHSGKTTAPTAFDHTIGLNRFKPFDNFTIRVVRLTRPSGMPVWADGTAGGRTDRDKWQMQAQAAINASGLNATIKDKLTYPYTAAAAITFSSKEFSNLPQRSYLLEGMKVRIPNTYTPREYTTNEVADYSGFWNGGFKPELYYTDNPAWIFYDIVTNQRYGAGKWIHPNDINEYALYRIAQYCDELVDDGNGGTEPRFRANLYLSKSTEIFKVLKDMASMFTGMLYWMDGKLNVVQDLPSDPVYTFSKSNVINGIFNYEGTSRKNRTNQVIVTWNDPTANYEPVALVVEDREAIGTSGKLISENVVAMGSTSEGQAIRYGRWKLWTAQNQKEVVSFQTGLHGAYIRPGDVINVQDKNRYGVDLSGRIASSTAPTANTITLDRPIELQSGTYTLHTLVESYAAFYTGLNTITVDGVPYNKGDRITGNVWSTGSGNSNKEAVTSEAIASSAFADENRTTPLPLTWKPYTYIQENNVDTSVTGTGTGITSLTTSANFGVTPDAGTVWALTHISGGREILGSVKEYKVLAVSQDDEKNTFSVTAVEYYVQKYDAVDKDYALGVVDGGVYEGVEDPEGAVPAPANIFIVLETDAKQPGEELRIEWEKSQEEFTDSSNNTQERDYEFFAGYEFVHNIPNHPSPMFTEQTSIRFDNVPNGFYTFRVRTLSKKGNSSDFISTQYDVEDPYGANVARMQGGIVKGGKSNAQISINSSTQVAFQVNPCAFASLGDPLNTRTITNNYSLTSLATATPYYVYVGTSIKLIYWDEYSLRNLPFWREINAGSNHLSSQASEWTSLGSVTILKNSNTVTGSGFSSSVLPRDVVSFGEEIFPSKDIFSISVGSSPNYYVTISTENDPSGTGVVNPHGLSDGDRILIKTTIAGGASNLDDRYFYVDVQDSYSFILYDDYDADTGTFSNPPQNFTTYNLTSYTENGTFQQIHADGAIVTAVISDTELRLDRAFDHAVSTTAYRSDFRPDYEQHAIVAEVTRGFFQNSYTYSINSFLVIDPNLSLGKSILVSPSISSLRYDGSGTLQTSYSSITATATAIGFVAPKFKFSAKSSGLSGTLDTSYQSPDSAGGNTYTFDIHGSTAIAFNNGIVEEITVEAIEDFDTGDVFEGKGFVAKSSTGADGVAGHTVTLEAEDYTVIYNDSGTSPVYNGSGTNSTLDFTATPSTSISSPEYYFTFEPGNVTTTDFTKTGFGAWQSGATATVSVPSNADSWDDSGSELPGSYSVKVQVRESGSNTVLAFDIVTVQGIRAAEDGYWISFSNEAHTIPTTFDGIPEGTAGTTSNYVIGEGSGLTIEVGKGSEILNYVTGTPGEGQWGISIDSSSGIIPSGAVIVEASGGYAWNSTTGLLTIDDHEFSEGWTADVASVTYTINLENQSTIYRTQTFTKSKKGFAGIQVTNTNPAQSLAADSNGKVISYSDSGTQINVQAFGTSIPYYTNSGASTAGVTTFWNVGTPQLTPSSSITVGTIAVPTTTLTDPVTVGIHSAMDNSVQKVTITYPINVTINGTLETYETKQVITKNTNASAIALIPSVTHVTFNSSGGSATPSNYSFTWANPAIPAGINPYYILNDGSSNVTTGTGTSSGNISSTPHTTLPRTYTVTMYDGNGGDVLASDKVTIGKSLDGTPGSTGVSYTGTTEYYRLTNSSSAPSRYSSGDNIASAWNTSPQSPTSSNQYLWNFNRNSKSDGTFTDSAVTLITQYVEDGRGISSISEAYQRHTSGTSAPTGTWYSSFASAGSLTSTYRFMWNRTRVNYTDGTNSGYIYTVIAVRGEDGSSVTGPAGPAGFMYFIRPGSGTSTTPTNGTQLGRPSTSEAPTASLSVGQIAIVSNSANPPDQQGWRYTGSSWSAQDIVNSDIIFANAIGTEQLEISSDSGTNRIFMDSGVNGPRIQIFDSSASNPRVILGKLT